MKILALIIFFSSFCSNIHSARILGIFHVPTTSHNIIGVTLLKSLAERGHQVTILSELNPKLNNPNVTYIPLEGMLDFTAKLRRTFNKLSFKNTLTYYKTVVVYGNQLSEKALQQNSLKKLMKTDTNYDIVFIEPFFNQAFVGFGGYFNAQVVVLTTSSSFVPNSLFGNIDVYSFVPHGMSSQSDKMNFWERLRNIYDYFYSQIVTELSSNAIQEKLYNTHFPNAFLNYNQAIKNVSLHLVNSHVMYESPRPYLPNMIPIGGLHLKAPKKLPKEIQEYLDEAKEGAIFFSLGSFLHSKDLPEEKRNAIIKTFSKLPQRVLWKFEGDLPELPVNVKISEWYPQNDILGHPNIKLFISHCGQLSSVEAVYNGIPILGMPLIFDQYQNIAYFVSKGYGEQLLFDEINEKTFTAKIKQILNNSSYSERIKEASRIVRDQPETPLERAIFWTEHIIKHGSRHLRPASLDLSIAEYLLLDVLAFFLFITIVFICAIIYFVNQFSPKRKHKIE